MKARMTKKAVEFLSNPKDADTIVQAINSNREKLHTGQSVEVFLPTLNKTITIKQVDSGYEINE